MLFREGIDLGQGCPKMTLETPYAFPVPAAPPSRVEPKGPVALRPRFSAGLPLSAKPSFTQLPRSAQVLFNNKL